MNYRSPAPIVSSRDSSPGRDNEYNDVQERLIGATQGTQTVRKTPVTTGAIRKTPRLDVMKTIARADDDGWNVRIPDQDSTSPTKRRKTNDDVADKRLSVSNQPSNQKMNQKGDDRRLSVPNRPTLTFSDEWSRDGGNDWTSVPTCRPTSESRPTVANTQTPIRRPNDQEPRDVEDKDELLQRQYDEMCAGLLRVVQTTVQEFLRSRSPTPTRRQVQHPSGPVSRDPPVQMEETRPSPRVSFQTPNNSELSSQRMPFGLTNSPATMCRLMYRVLGHDLEPFVFGHIDDIVILAQSVQHMLQLLAEVGKRLSAASLSVNLKKCRFFVKEAKYLGYLISADGLRTDPDKLRTMRPH